MKIQYLQHVPFEDIAYVGNWADKNGVHLGRTRLYEDDPYPFLSDFDVLIVIEGPMGVYDEQEYPWLKTEKAYIRKAIHNKKIVVGICLGAQLIAAALGAKVYQNSFKEIGWFPVYKTPRAKNTSLGEILPKRFMAFHWHGDTFDIPKGAVHLAESKACKNQALVYLNRVIALQFHLESTQSSIESLIQNCRDEVISAPFIQTADQIRKGYHQIESLNTIMAKLMNRIILRNG
ncbi:MAG: type 1 glutamine amidotransferase [Desulfobacterales bacterium]